MGVKVKAVAVPSVSCFTGNNKQMLNLDKFPCLLYLKH